MKKIFYVSTAILLMSKAYSLDFCVKDSESFATTSKKLKEHLEETVKSGEKSLVSLQVDKDILLKSKSATGGEVFIKTAAATYVKAPCLMMVMVDTYQDLDRDTILRQGSNYNFGSAIDLLKYDNIDRTLEMSSKSKVNFSFQMLMGASGCTALDLKNAAKQIGLNFNFSCK